MLESRAGIILRPSLLNLDVRVSVHPASDVLTLRFCSCRLNRGNFREGLEDFCSSSLRGFHQHDVDVSSRH